MIQGIFSTFLSPFQTIIEMDKGLMSCPLVGTELLLGSTWSVIQPGSPNCRHLHPEFSRIRTWSACGFLVLVNDDQILSPSKLLSLRFMVPPGISEA